MMEKIFSIYKLYGWRGIDIFARLLTGKKLLNNPLLTIITLVSVFLQEFSARRRSHRVRDQYLVVSNESSFYPVSGHILRLDSECHVFAGDFE